MPSPTPTNRPNRFSVIHREAMLPIDIDRAFAFFADAGNLERITPAWLNFRILTPRPIPMHVGALIDYRIRVRGVPLRWRTEIIAWEPPPPERIGTRRTARFVDFQISGPYHWWHHEHRFEEHSQGTLMVDRVEYRAPLHALSDPLLVRRDLARIFDFRAEALAACITEMTGSG